MVGASLNVMSREPVRQRRLVKIGRYELRWHRWPEEPFGQSLIVLRKHPRRRRLRPVRPRDSNSETDG